MKSNVELAQGAFQALVDHAGACAGEKDDFMAKHGSLPSCVEWEFESSLGFRAVYWHDEFQVWPVTECDSGLDEGREALLEKANDVLYLLSVGG